MAKYRKKPVVIEATQWFKNGDHPCDESIPVELEGLETFLSEGKVVRYFWHPSVASDTVCKHCGKTMFAHGWIDTPQGGHTVCPGDWIIDELTRPGQFYPCKPDAFDATYEKVED